MEIEPKLTTKEASNVVIMQWNEDYGLTMQVAPLAVSINTTAWAYSSIYQVTPSGDFIAGITHSCFIDKKEE